VTWPVIIEQNPISHAFRARWWTNGIGTPVSGEAAPGIAGALRNLADALDAEGQRQAYLAQLDGGD
jgi:hypothetical protein